MPFNPNKLDETLYVSYANLYNSPLGFNVEIVPLFYLLISLLYIDFILSSYMMVFVGYVLAYHAPIPSTISLEKESCKKKKEETVS